MRTQTLTQSPDTWLESEPENPRQCMEPSDMDPDDARQFMLDLMRGIYNKMQQLPDDDFKPDSSLSSNAEKAKQYYGNDMFQLLSGIEAALRKWDESGTNTKELKEMYGGRFVEGVEIGERLAVYHGIDFTFVESEESKDDSSNEFTFVQ